MDKRQCFELGYIERVHGLDGAVVAVFDVDQPSYYRKLDAVFIEHKNQLVPYLVQQIASMNGKKAVIRLDGIDNEEKAQELKGLALYLPESSLPPLKNNQFYFHELVGAQVVDHHFGELGKISSIYEYPQQTLLAMDWQETEVLIPLNDAIVTRFDRSKNMVQTNLPEGLLDVYLQPGEKEMS